MQGQDLFHWKTRFFVAASYEVSSLLRMTSFHLYYLGSVPDWEAFENAPKKDTHEKENQINLVSRIAALLCCSNLEEEK